MFLPPPSSPPLSLPIIQAGARAAQWCYDHPTFTDSASGESFFLEGDDKTIVIAFPGTHNFRDVLADVDCLRESTVILGQPCSVHKGFARSHQATIAEVLRQLKAAGVGDGSYRIIGAGHSKGAGVLNRCMLGLLENNIPVDSVVKFGEPRGGDGRYATIYNNALGNRTLSLANGADPIPWMPCYFAGNRPLLPNGYMPLGKDQIMRGVSLFYELANNFREIMRGWNAIAELRTNPIAAWEELEADNPLNDHHMAAYMDRLGRITSL